MGYFQDKSTSRLTKEIFRGVKIIFLGMMLNILMNLSLIYQYFNNQIDVNIFQYIFGVDILIFAGLSYILLAIIRRLINKQLLFLVLIVIIYLFNYILSKITINSEILIYLFSLFTRLSDWSYFPLIPWISFPIIGIVLNRTKIFEKFLSHKFSKFFWFIYF